MSVTAAWIPRRDTRHLIGKPWHTAWNVPAPSRAPCVLHTSCSRPLHSWRSATKEGSRPEVPDLHPEEITQQEDICHCRILVDSKYLPSRFAVRGSRPCPFVPCEPGIGRVQEETLSAGGLALALAHLSLEGDERSRNVPPLVAARSASLLARLCTHQAALESMARLPLLERIIQARRRRMASRLVAVSLAPEGLAVICAVVVSRQVC